jgi:type VI protein secretion system component Hcp
MAVVGVVVLCSAPAVYAMDMYVSIVGATQGPFRGELMGAGFEGKFAPSEVTWGADVTRDPSTGPRRVYQVVTMKKIWGPTSYQLYAAMRANEQLTVTIDYVLPNPLDSKQMFDSTVKLVGAMVSKFETSSNRGEPAIDHTLEFVFTRIEVTDRKTNTTQVDSGIAVK